MNIEDNGSFLSIRGTQWSDYHRRSIVCHRCQNESSEDLVQSPGVRSGICEREKTSKCNETSCFKHMVYADIYKSSGAQTGTRTDNNT